MRRCTLFLLAAGFVCLPINASAQAKKLPLHVLYLGRSEDADRTQAFGRFLSDRFRQCTVVQRERFTANDLSTVDVVLLDWSQRERPSREYGSPLGPLENWDKPLVLLGSAGLIQAGPWHVIGGAG